VGVLRQRDHFNAPRFKYRGGADLVPKAVVEKFGDLPEMADDVYQECLMIDDSGSFVLAECDGYEPPMETHDELAATKIPLGFVCEARPTATAAGATGSAGSGSSRSACRLPFAFNGRIYDGCVTDRDAPTSEDRIFMHFFSCN
jgi:hypothetical protein